MVKCQCQAASISNPLPSAHKEIRGSPKALAKEKVTSSWLCWASFPKKNKQSVTSCPPTPCQALCPLPQRFLLA